MVTKEIKLTPEQVRATKLKVDQNELELVRKRQQLKAWEEDLEDEVPMKHLRVQIRGLTQQIEQIEAENKVYLKRLREGKEVIEETTLEDVDKFEKAKKEE